MNAGFKRGILFIFDLKVFDEECINQKEVCTGDLFEAKKDWGSDSIEPIFILGLPRVGSTLLEQILASHSMVEATHELPNILAISHKLNLRKALEKSSFESFKRVDDFEFGLALTTLL